MPGHRRNVPPKFIDNMLQHKIFCKKKENGVAEEMPGHRRNDLPKFISKVLQQNISQKEHLEAQWNAGHWRNIPPKFIPKGLQQKILQKERKFWGPKKCQAIGRMFRRNLYTQCCNKIFCQNFMSKYSTKVQWYPDNQTSGC